MIYTDILRAETQQQKLLSILIDPDKVSIGRLVDLAKSINNSPATHILVGGSLLQSNELSLFVSELKKYTDLPVILFPGNCTQITSEADALLFLSLLSGRNPEYLIGQQVQAAPIIKRIGLETIATAYVLIDSGVPTSVSYISNTTPIPRDKTDIAVATAVAAELLGMKMIYLEAGSGARQAVPIKTVKAICDNVSIPVIVGGGLKNEKEIEEMHTAGAAMVVVGTAFEINNNLFK